VAGNNFRAQEFFQGIKAEIPILIGVIPFGMIYGVLAIDAGLKPTIAQAMSAIVFAGSSQFISTQMFAAGSPGLMIILTVAVVNLRHLLYSASVAPYLVGLKRSWKWILAYLLTDEAYAVAITHYRKPGDQRYRHWFFLGAGLALWSSWQASTAVGIFLGSIIPPDWPLDFTLALTFIALLVPGLKDRANVLTAIVAGVVAIFAYNLPYKLGLILAAVIGIAAGVWMENRK
jgi:4-azaleucine resistance transporter AzlC